jgi:hypothetical protein
MASYAQTRELGVRAEALYRRLAEIEATLGVREWWLLGRALPEARLLAEIASLLAVARAELETALTQVFGTRIAGMAGAVSRSGAGAAADGGALAPELAAIRADAAPIRRTIRVACRGERGLRHRRRPLDGRG